MNNENKEYRSFEIRSVGDDQRTIEGYAVVFNSTSRYLGFFETIDKTAITQELVDQSDVIANYNHDDEKILARWTRGHGTLSLILDDKGLKYRFVALNTPLGNEVYENIKAGNLFEASFCFTVDESDKDAQTWSKDNDGNVVRTIHKINGLYDVAICPRAAYAATSAVTRKLQEMQEKPQFDPFEAIMTAINDLCED